MHRCWLRRRKKRRLHRCWLSRKSGGMRPRIRKRRLWGRPAPSDSGPAPSPQSSALHSDPQSAPHAPKRTVPILQLRVQYEFGAGTVPAKCLYESGDGFASPRICEGHAGRRTQSESTRVPKPPRRARAAGPMRGAGCGRNVSRLHRCGRSVSSTCAVLSCSTNRDSASPIPTKPRYGTSMAPVQYFASTIPTQLNRHPQVYEDYLISSVEIELCVEIRYLAQIQPKMLTCVGNRAKLGPIWV